MKTTSRDPLMSAPRHLSNAMRKWVARVCEKYEVAENDFKLLVMAAESWDLAENARIVIRKRGVSYLDRFGQPRQRPECAVLRDSRIAFIRIMRELNLEHETPVADESPKKHPRIPPHIPTNQKG